MVAGAPKIYTEEFINNEAAALELWMTNPSNIFKKRFAFERGYSEPRMLEFCKVNKKFSSAYERLKEWQEMKLAEGALKDEYKFNVVQFLMINNCGYKSSNSTSQVSSETTTNLNLNDVKSSKDLIDDEE